MTVRRDDNGVIVLEGAGAVFFGAAANSRPLALSKFV